VLTACSLRAIRTKALAGCRTKHQQQQQQQQQRGQVLVTAAGSDNVTGVEVISDGCSSHAQRTVALVHALVAYAKHASARAAR